MHSGFAAAPSGGFARSGNVRGSYAAMAGGAAAGAAVAGHNWAGHNGEGHGHRHFVRGFGIGGYGGYGYSDGYYGDDSYYGDQSAYSGSCSYYQYDQSGNAYCVDGSGGTAAGVVGW
jgi:hypothetical protein